MHLVCSSVKTIFTLFPRTSWKKISYLQFGIEPSALEVTDSQQQAPLVSFITFNIFRSNFLSAEDHFSKDHIFKVIVGFCLGVGGSFSRAPVLLTLLSLKVQCPKQNRKQNQLGKYQGKCKYYLLYIIYHTLVNKYLHGAYLFLQQSLTRAVQFHCTVHFCRVILQFCKKNMSLKCISSHLVNFFCCNMCSSLFIRIISNVISILKILTLYSVHLNVIVQDPQRNTLPTLLTQTVNKSIGQHHIETGSYKEDSVLL